MRRLTWVILFLCAFSVASRAAEADTSGLLHFNVDNGFPSNNVYSVIQDKLGYLWFATDNGIVKYNGYSFRIFNTSKGLPSNDAFELYEDKRGRIWVNSISYQFGYIQNNKYHETHMKLDDRIFRATSMTDTGAYMFLLFVQKNFFCLAIIKEDLVSVVPLCPLGEVQSAGDQKKLSIASAALTKKFKLYFGGSDGVAYVYDLLKPGNGYKRLCPFQLPIDYLKGGALAAADDNIIYGLPKTGRFIYVNNLNTCSQSELSFNNDPDEHIYQFIPSYQTNFPGYVVITNKYLYGTDWRKVTYKIRIDSLIKTPSQVAFIFRDKSNNTWYTTNSDGAWCKPRQHAKFTRIKSPVDLHESKYVGMVDTTSYWWSKKKSLYYSVSGDGAVKTKALPFKEDLKSVARYNDSFMLLALADGTFKIDKHSHRIVSIIDPDKKTVVRFNGKQTQRIIDESANALFFGNTFQILQGATNNFFSVRSQGFFEFKETNDSLICRGIAFERFTNLVFDSIGQNMIAFNYQKVLVYNLRSERYVTITTGYLKSLGLNNIQNICTDRYYNIYVKSDDKLLVYNPLLNKTCQINSDFNFTESFIKISGNILLVAGKFGVAKAVVNGPLSLSGFTIVPNNGYYNRVTDFAFDTRGNIFLNTDKDFYRLNIKDPVGGNLFRPSDPDFFKIVLETPFEKRLLNNDTIRLPQKTDKISFDAINFFGKGNVIYKYAIGSPPKSWIQIDHELSVSGFSPGKYWKVNIVSTDDKWNSRQLTFYIYRFPYWWQRPAWKAVLAIACVLLFAGLLLATIVITRRVVVRNNEKKRSLTELELKAIYAQINPHFIFNTLNAAQYFINKKRFDDAYTHVSKFSRLLRSYLKSSQDRYVVLDEEIQMLKNYIELQQTRFEEKFEYRMEVENKIPVHNIKIPSLLLQPLVENAINHGLFHKESGGLLVIKFLQGVNSQQLVCIIEDNGVGRERSGTLNKAIADRKESYGTKLTQQLINIYKEYEHVDIHLEYIDKSGEDTGTIVKLVIGKTKFAT